MRSPRALETRWRFTPRVAWVAGDYALVALTLLEDPAGNRLGRAFEVMESVGEEKEGEWRSAFTNRSVQGLSS